MVLARADPRRRAPCFALPRRGLHDRFCGGAARDGASGEGRRCRPTRVVGARADGAGTATTQTFSTTGRFGFANDPEHRRAQVSAGDASGPRPAGTGAQRPPGKSKASGAALPPCSRSRWPPGVTPRARAPVAAPRSTPAPRLPAAASSRKSKLTPCCLSRAAPAAASAQSSKRTLSLRGATRCPAASCHHGGGRLAPLPLALGRGPPLPPDELGLPHDHLYHNSAVAVGARRGHDQETPHPGDGKKSGSTYQY